jgi:hypothetical protein
MNRIFKILASSLFVCLIPFSIVIGQEKKCEKKIKIIVADDSGEKVVIDTLMNEGMNNDSISLKDGKVIYLKQARENGHRRKDKGDEYVTVTVTDDGKRSKKIVKEITIMSSDSATCNMSEDCDKIVMYGDSSDFHKKHHGQYKVITKTIKAEGGKDQTIYISDGDDSEKEIEETINVTVDTDDKDSEIENTRYVISKNGMVVTVEGEDYAKVKELVKEIENKLDKK